MRHIIAAFLAGLFITGCAGAQASPSEKTDMPIEQTPVPVEQTAVPVKPTAVRVEQPAAAQRHVCYENICLSIDASVTTEVTAARFPATEGTDLPYWETLPELIQFDFSGYPAGGDIEPQVVVVPLDLDHSDRIGNNLDALKTLITTGPDLSRTFAAYMPAQGSQVLPIFPQTNAVCAIAAGMRYQNFQWGSGMRFVSAFAQGPAPVAPEELVYLYQGISDDGRYYVAARFPVTLDSASAAKLGQPPSPDSDLDTSTKWNRGFAEQLRQLPDGAYVPSLNSLDAMVGSISTAAAAVR